MRFNGMIVPGLVVVLLLSSAASGQDKVYTSMTTEQLENLMKDMEIQFKKMPGKNDVVFYDFERNNYKIRMHYFAGKDLMLDALFAKFPVDKINQWNIRAKFSRAVLHKDDKGEFTALEWNLDLLGGVTDAAVKHFIKTFDQEVKDFDKFLGAAAVPSTPQVEDVYKIVTSDRLEKIFDGLKLTYKKSALKSGGEFYDFERSNFKMRLYNYGGKDLMIDATFRKAPLEEVNKYNLDRKFIRAVLYSQGGNEWTALESYLEGAGGVTDSIVRHFINVFDEEVKAYAKYLSK
jgi:hypothetical protein